MIAYDDIELSPDLSGNLTDFAKQVEQFRQEGPLDPVAIAKLREHFKASHIYHSAGIEGNRLTLQETFLVLQEGLDISGKPLKDSLEVKSLGQAYECLKELADRSQPVRESDIRSIHSLLLSHDPELSPGQYRNIGVIISGSQFRPPEPMDVPARMEELIKWIAENLIKDPIITSAIAHHELASIHPFKDGNGRVARLLMNLILLKHGYPICNIRREDRPQYYDSLSFADVGLFEPLVDLILSRCKELFSELVRIRLETKRMAEWAQRWGTRETEILRRRESRELELWQSRMRQVFLEFQKAAELLNEKIQGIDISFFDWKNEISLERYQQLISDGFIDRGNAFSIGFRESRTGHQERFMFRYYRNRDKFPWKKFIPLELNHREETGYLRLSDVDWAWGECVRIRELYFTEEGKFVVRYYDAVKREEMETEGIPISEVVQWFFDDVLKHIFGLC